MPALAEAADPGSYLDACRAALGRGLPRRKASRAALGHALAFSTWRSLDREGLADREAAELMATLIVPAVPG
jgi:hypothetical protein